MSNGDSILYLLYPDFSASRPGKVAPQATPAHVYEERLSAMEETPVEATKTADLLSFDGPANGTMVPSVPTTTPHNNYAFESTNTGNVATRDLLAVSDASGSEDLLSLPAASSTADTGNPFGVMPLAGNAIVSAANPWGVSQEQQPPPAAVTTNPLAQQQPPAAPLAPLTGDPWAQQQPPQQPAPPAGPWAQAQSTAAPPNIWG